MLIKENTKAIEELLRTYVIYVNNEKDETDDVLVEMEASSLNPADKNFSRCKISCEITPYRTINEHIKFYKGLIEGLEKLQTYLIGNNKEYENLIFHHMSKN